MTQAACEEILEGLASDLVLADASDAGEMASIGAKLAALSAAYAGAGLAAEAAYAGEGGRRLTACLAGGDAAGALEDLKARVAALQKGMAPALPAPAGAPPSPAAQDPRQQQNAAYLEDFLGSLADHLEVMERLGLELERSFDADRMAELRRTVHTVKGEAGIVRERGISTVCHELESAMQEQGAAFRFGQVLACKDWLAGEAGRLRGAPPPGHPGPEEVAARIRDPGQSTDGRAPAPGGDAELRRCFLAEARDHLLLIERELRAWRPGAAPDAALLLAYRAAHAIKGSAGVLGDADLTALAAGCEGLLGLLRGGFAPVSPELAGLLLRSVDAMRAAIYPGDAPRTGGEAGAVAALLADALKAAAAATPRPAPTPAALRAGLTGAEGDADGHGAAPGATIRIDTGKLDRIINMAGEIITCQSQINRELEELRASRSLVANMQLMRVILAELQDLSMSLRMVPLRATFRKMERIARDAARQLDRPVDFVAEGEDTEIDRHMAEKLADPLVHLVRNAVDHGLEPVDARRLAGKPAHGRVVLRAFHQGGHIVVEVEDDGRGMDAARILAKARERGLLAAGQDPPEAEVLRLLFEPGFSMSERVTELSGRGVGLDVVRREVEALRGRVEIRTRRGAGSVFAVHLPLTLAIIDGMVVRVGGVSFVVPTVNVEQTFATAGLSFATVQRKGRMFDFRGRMLPVVDLHGFFGLDGHAERRGAPPVLLVVNSGLGACALLVDDILARQEVVIKPLGESFRRLQGISGGAIMNDGRVGLIMDVQGIVDRAKA